MTADRSPDATADAVAVAGSGHLPPHEDWCCAKGCPGPGYCGDGKCPGDESACTCVVQTARHYVNKALTEAADEVYAEAMRLRQAQMPMNLAGAYAAAANLIRARRT